MPRFLAAVVIVLMASLLTPLPHAPAAAARCTIIGTAHGDRLVGTAGRDVICGRGGNDILRGRGGNDLLIGGDGRDQLFPGLGRNTVRGGAGADTVRYDRLPSGVTVDLPRGRTTGAVTDTVAGVENVVGTSDRDRLIGTPGANRLDAGGDIDVIQPRGGDDVVHGGGDRLARFHGDTLSYHGVGTAVQIDMPDGTVDGAGHTTFDGIINIAGTRHDDVLTAGDDPWTVVYALSGDDLISGTVECGYFGGGPGDDTLVPGLPAASCAVPGEASGHGGSDTVTYADAAGPLVVAQAYGDEWQVTGTDQSWSRIADTETLVGTAFDDVLAGGRGAVNVTFDGGGGVDDIDTTDGVGGDTILGGSDSTCAGDPTDTINC